MKVHLQRVVGMPVCSESRVMSAFQNRRDLLQVYRKQKHLKNRRLINLERDFWVKLEFYCNRNCILPYFNPQIRSGMQKMMMAPAPLVGCAQFSFHLFPISEVVSQLCGNTHIEMHYQWMDFHMAVLFQWVPISLDKQRHACLCREDNEILRLHDITSSEKKCQAVNARWFLTYWSQEHLHFLPCIQTKFPIWIHASDENWPASSAQEILF